MSTQTAPAGLASDVEQTPVIEARNITKYYGSLVALDNVSLTVQPREIVGLVGDNGAGKSTLVKVLAGAHAPSSGDLLVDGEPCAFRSPLEARKLGIETVYQELALSTELTVAENMYLGRELRRRGALGRIGMVNKRAMAEGSAERLTELGIRIRSTKVPCRSLSGGQRQAIAVARAIAWGSRLVLLDEPTAALGVEQQHHVGELVENVRAAGTSVLLISHNMPQVHALCDRILVLYRGEIIANLTKSDVTVQDIVMWITGAALQ